MKVRCLMKLTLLSLALHMGEVVLPAMPAIEDFRALTRARRLHAAYSSHALTLGFGTVHQSLHRIP